MAEVTIYLGDSDILSNVQTDLEAASVSDYVPIYDQLVKAIHNGKKISVKVSHNSVGNWLKDLGNRYGTNHVNIKKLSYRGKLKDLLGINIPDWVQESQIRDADLLSIDISPKPNTEFEDFILNVFFSPWLSQPRIPLSRLGELIQSIDQNQWHQNINQPLIGDILRRRTTQWQDKADSEGEKLIIEWLLDSPDQLKKKLGLFKVLQNYPSELGIRIFGEEYNYLVDLDLELTDIHINESLVRPALDLIRVHLEELTRLQNKQESINKLLDQVSGHLEIEFDVLQSLLHSTQIEVSQNLVRQIKSVFAPLKHRPYLDQAIADLDLLVKVPEPPAPDPDPDHPWNENEWIDWAVKSYLPYRYWLEEVGKLTGNINAYAKAYANWLYRNYPEMRLSSKRMIYQALPKFRELMVSGKPVLILIVDNFNNKFLSDFSRYLQTEAFYREELEYYISMLPSCTEVSKKSLILGQPEPFSGTSYGKIVEETWSEALHNCKVCYLPHIKALREINEQEHDVYFLNYLPIDIAFHQDEEQVGISHAQMTRSYLRALASDVRAFAQRIGADRDLIVILVSDHGSTRIPKEAPNIIDLKFFAKRINDKHHRYVSISDKGLEELPDNTRYQCYVFEKGRFGLEENYLAAQNYYRFIETNESSYIHGGLTPEETIVPVAVFTPLTVKPKPLEVILKGNEFYYGRKSEIQVEIINTNSHDCLELKVDIRNSGIVAEPIIIERLSSLSQRTINLEGKFRRYFSKNEKLHLQFTYDFLGQPQKDDVELEVRMKSISEQSFDLNEIFDI